MPASDASNATDLDLLQLGVHQLTRERQPQGEVVQVEDAASGQQLFGLAVALEDTNWLQNDDKRRIDAFVDQAIARIRAARMPACRWFELTCRSERRAAQRRIDNRGQPP